MYEVAIKETIGEQKLTAVLQDSGAETAKDVVSLLYAAMLGVQFSPDSILEAFSTVVDENTHEGNANDK